MTIDEAIKRMKARVDGDFSDGDSEDLSDMKLGIEALKRMKEIRTIGSSAGYPFLLGETEE